MEWIKAVAVIVGVIIWIGVLIANPRNFMRLSGKKDNIDNEHRTAHGTK